MSAFPSGPLFSKITAAFTTRNAEGRSSFGALSSDEKTAGLNESRIMPRSVCETLGLDFAAFTSGVQAHERKVVRVTDSEKGRGALNYYEGIPDTDGLITDAPEVPVGVFTADCVPVFLYDPVRPAVGIVHAGWRSTVRSIVECAVGMMAEEFHSQPENLYAAIGPSIGQCCYEVGRDVYEQFHSAFGYADALFKRTAQDKWRLDLWDANRRQLLGLGVRSDRIFDHGICSSCRSEEFSSARKHGPRAGRTLSLIALQDQPTRS